MRTITILFLSVVLTIPLAAERTIIPTDLPTIQAGIDAAAVGDTILVLPGIYLENIDFTGKDIVILSTTGRDSTTIDGGGISSVVKFISGETRAAVLDGFTITNGAGITGTSCPRYGGGVVCRPLSSPTLRNLYIVDNAVVGTGSSGGGIGISTQCDPLLEHVIIEDNDAYYAGGMNVYQSSVTLRDVTFHHNYAYMEGGGISATGGSISAADVIFSQNRGRLGGAGIWLHANSEALIQSATFVGNDAGGSFRGGAFLLTDNSVVHVVNSITWDNSPDELATYTQGFAPNTVSISYSAIDGGEGRMHFDAEELILFSEIFEDDPEFVNEDSSDFNLMPESLCIDAGTTIYCDPVSGDTLFVCADTSYLGLAPDMGRFEYDATTGVSPESGRPENWALDQNYPNPFNPSTTIRFRVREASYTRLVIHDLQGRLVKTLLEDDLPAGSHELQWNGQDFRGAAVPSGIYLIVFSTPRVTMTQRITLLR